MKNALNKLSKKYRSIIVIGAVVVIGVTILSLSNASTPSPVKVQSGGAEFILSPSSGTYAPGKTIAVKVFEDTCYERVNAVDVSMSYDSTKLDFVSINIDGGSFPDCFGNQGGSGKVYMGCGKIQADFTYTGKQLIGTVTFKVKDATGSAAISHRSDAQIHQPSETGSTGIWSGNTAGATFTIGSTSGGSNPDPTPPTGGGSGGGSSSGSGGSSSSGGGSSNTSSGGGSNGGSSSSSGSSEVATPSTEPVSGSSQGGSGESIALKILDKDGLPLVGATVTLKNVTAVSDSQGYVRYYGVTAGVYTVSVKTADGDMQQKITVKDTGSGETVQEFSVQVKPKSMLVYYLIAGGLLLLLISALYVAFSKFQQRARFRRTHGLDTNKAVVFDSKADSKEVAASKIDQGPMIKPENQEAKIPETKTEPEKIEPIKPAEPIEPKVEVKPKPAPVETSSPATKTAAVATSNIPTPPTGQTPGNIITPKVSDTPATATPVKPAPAK